ncbi:MAG: YbaY family lipoprotein [Vicinamibacteraceae bacterium]
MLTAPALAGAQAVAASDFVGRTWLSTDAAASPGTLRIFLADGTLLMDSCGETYRLATWRAPRPGRIEWTEDGARIEAEVSEPRAGELRLRLRLRGGDARDERYRLATVPYVCPDSRPDPGPAALRVSGRVIFLERLALPRSATVRVELRDTSRVGAPARTLATQTIPATQGPPFVFDLSVPAATVDPRASLSLFAEIRDGRRLMFTTDTRHPVPREGATDMDVRLRSVGGR